MLTPLRDHSRPTNLLTAAVALAVLALAFLLGQRASALWLGLLLAGFGALVLLARPSLGLFALVAAALVARLEFGTGTDVTVNPVTLLVPAVGVVWLLDQVRRGRIRVVASPANLPLARLGYRLHRRYRAGFAAAYVNGMLAAGVGSLVIMLFADWILPFVYNIQFVGFQASVLVWLFMGGLVALENMPAAVTGER